MSHEFRMMVENDSTSWVLGDMVSTPRLAQFAVRSGIPSLPPSHHGAVLISVRCAAPQKVQNPARLHVRTICHRYHGGGRVMVRTLDSSDHRWTSLVLCE